MSSANRKRLKLPRIDSSVEGNSKLYEKSSSPSSPSSSSVNMVETNRIIMRDGFQYFEIE
jgi:hypothetical protein